MAKQTTNNQEQGFVYQLGQDVAKLGIEIEQLKNKTGKALRVSVPAKPEKYSSYELPATVELPKEYQNAICIKTIDGNVELIKTTNAITLSATSTEQVIYIAPILRLQDDNIQATFDAEKMSLIDESIERQERERQERERQERERQERDYRENYVYYGLVKYAKEKYARELALKDSLDDIKLVPNWLGLNDFLSHPFLRIVDEMVSSMDDYLDNTQDIIRDLKAQVSKFESEKRDIDGGMMTLDLSKLEKPKAYRLSIL